MALNSPGVDVAGEELRKLRRVSGDNLKSFAAKAGVSLGYLSQIELGDRPSVSTEVFSQICDALGIDKNDRHVLVRKAAA